MEKEDEDGVIGEIASLFGCRIWALFAVDGSIGRERARAAATDDPVSGAAAKDCNSSKQSAERDEKVGRRQQHKNSRRKRTIRLFTAHRSVTSNAAVASRLSVWLVQLAGVAFLFGRCGLACLTGSSCASPSGRKNGNRASIEWKLLTWKERRGVME